MAINTWSEAQRPDYAKVLREREEALERGRQRRKQEQEALEWKRQQKAQQERDDLWSWYENDYDVADSFKAQERAQEAARQRELKQEIGAELLAVEVEQALKVEQSSNN